MVIEGSKHGRRARSNPFVWRTSPKEQNRLKTEKVSVSDEMFPNLVDHGTLIMNGRFITSSLAGL